jgi:hypothetical protein
MNSVQYQLNTHPAVRIPIVVCSLLIVLAIIAWLTGNYTYYSSEYGPFCSECINMYISATAGSVLLVALVLYLFKAAPGAKCLYVISAGMYFLGIVASVLSKQWEEIGLFLLFTFLVLAMRVLMENRILNFIKSYTVSIARWIKSLWMGKSPSGERPIYPFLVYILGLGVVVNSIFVLSLLETGVLHECIKFICILIILISLCFMIVRKKVFYITFCVVYGILVTVNLTVNLLVSIYIYFKYGITKIPIDNMFVGIFLALVQIGLWLGLVLYYPYVFGSKAGIAYADKCLSKASKMEFKGEFEQAVALYQKVIDEYPHTPAAEDAQQCIKVLSNEDKIP